MWSAGASQLATARSRASDLFNDAGILIAWTTQGQAPGLMHAGGNYIQLVVVDAATNHVMAGHPILGFAIASASRVHVYYDRVQMLARDRNVQPSGFLGVVIAHELAHVLLSDARHTPTGVMAATLGPDPKVPPAFTGQQAQSMRARLGALGDRGLGPPRR